MYLWNLPSSKVSYLLMVQWFGEQSKRTIFQNVSLNQIKIQNGMVLLVHGDTRDDTSQPWQLKFSRIACGTLRKHVTKPFPQPAAPDNRNSFLLT